MSAFDNRSKDDLEMEIRNFLEENTIGDLLAVVKWCIESKVEDAFESKDYAECVIEELEKIKAEIGKEFVDLQDGSEEWRSYVNESVLSCYEIVEKHISKLKGE